MKKQLKRLAIAGAVSAAIGVVGSPAANADAILFPYMVFSPDVTSIMSVVNHGTVQANDIPAHQPDQLHYAYWHKLATAVENDDICVEVDREFPTTPEDLITFDVGGHFGNANGVLFNDGTDYAGSNFAQLETLGPTRGFLIVDNLTTDDGELYGEAQIFDHANGAMWGYRAYNGEDTQYLVPDFTDSNEIQGEVLMDDEFTPVEFLPLNEWVTAFFVTPVDTSKDNGDIVGQQWGKYTAKVRFYDTNPETGLTIVAWDRDEEPVSGPATQTVTCVGRVELTDLIGLGAQNSLQDGGWTYFDVEPGGVGIVNGNDLDNARDDANQAVVFKLEYNTGNTFNGEPINGVVNTAIWLRDNSAASGTVGARQGFTGIDGF